VTLGLGGLVPLGVRDTGCSGTGGTGPTGAGGTGRTGDTGASPPGSRVCAVLEAGTRGRWATQDRTGPYWSVLGLPVQLPAPPPRAGPPPRPPCSHWPTSRLAPPPPPRRGGGVVLGVGVRDSKPGMGAGAWGVAPSPTRFLIGHLRAGRAAIG